MIGGLPRKSASPGLLRTAIPPSSGFLALLITSRGLFVVALVLLCLLLSTKSGGVITVAVLKVLGISQPCLFLSHLQVRRALSRYKQQMEQPGVPSAA